MDDRMIDDVIIAAKDKLQALETGPLYGFSDWPIADVPRSGAIVYTVWNRENRFIYVGMAGKFDSAKGKGPFERLNSHASGRRSGDQFCIYVCDRFVLLQVHNRISEIAEGKLSLDNLTREFIRSELGFRFQTAADSQNALATERQIQRGALPSGRPFFNPLPDLPLRKRRATKARKGGAR